MYITNRDITQVTLERYIAAGLWGRRLDLGYLNPTPRFFAPAPPAAVTRRPGVSLRRLGGPHLPQNEFDDASSSQVRPQQ